MNAEQVGGGDEGGTHAHEPQDVSVETIARVGETAAMLGGRVYDDDDVQKAVAELVAICRRLTKERTVGMTNEEVGMIAEMIDSGKSEEEINARYRKVGSPCWYHY